jgi:DNA-binding NarL/FixJ family response regulator
MASNQLVQQIISWQALDEISLSIRRKSKDRHPEARVVSNRYHLIPENNQVYFTYREMEIVMHLFEPITYKVIGQRMGLSDRTVECHVRRMRIKLGCKDRFDLIEKVMLLPIVKDFKNYYRAY